MRFFELAKILHKYHGGNIYEFTYDLLAAGISCGSDSLNELMSSDSGKDRLRKYYNGKRDINEIAIEIYSYYSYDDFEEYLEEYEEHFTDISNDLQILGIDIGDYDVPHFLSTEFDEILQRAANGKPDKKKEVNKPAQYSISSRHKERMENIIDKLLNMIANVFYGHEGQENSISFQIQYGEYVSLNSQLSSFVEIYPFIDSLKQVQMYQLKPTDFQFTYESGMRRLEYSDFLNSIRAELLKYPSNNL